MKRHSHRLDGTDYVAYLERHGETVARAAEHDLDAAVPGCPGWNVEELVWHLGGVHHFWGTIARERLQDHREVARPERPSREDLIAWYQATLAGIVETLRTADPSTRVWTWSSENDIAWIRRRMAHETAVHAWDAVSAIETPPPLDARLAVDGIDEFLEFFVTETKDIADVSVHLHATDVEGEWLAAIEDGRLRVSHDHAKGDVAVRGGASNLLLLLWGRVPEANVEVLGDRAALFKFLEAADLD